jgi:hypothetical protein
MTMTKTIQADAIKILARRDSATTILRKLGIQARDYDFFIEKMTDGRFACKIAMAEMHLESLKNPKPAVKSPGLRSPRDVFGSAMNAAKRHNEENTSKTAPKADTPKRDGISATARALILDGKTNQEVWDVLQAKFNLDHSKRHYPTWYRCEMKRTGLLPRDA